MAPGAGSWAEVRLLGVPVAVYLASRQHTDDLIRELWLMSAGDGDTGREHRRLVEAAEAYTRRGAGVRTAALDTVVAAQERGDATVDLEFRVPVASADLTEQWAGLLDSMNDLCVRGALLTLAAPAEVRRFRAWYVGEVLGQIRHARPPQPYAQWERSQLSTGS